MLARDPVGFLDRCRERYGPVFRIRFIGFPRYAYVADPDLAREVYAADRTVGRAGDARRDFLAPVVGEKSLLCLEDDEWLRHRKLLGPAFHRRHVDGWADAIAELAGEEIERWPAGTPIELRPRMQTITLEVILRLVFGITDAARLERLRTLLPKLMEGGVHLMWLVPPAVWRTLERRPRVRRLPANPLSAFLRVRDEVDALLFDEIHRRRAAGDDDGTDVLAQMLRARDEDGRGMDDRELRDELITLLEAGHETTATALAWAFERLLRTPAALERLRAEVDAGGDEYLDAVVRETLRSRSVILDTPRLLNGPLELAGHTIPAGWYVAPAMPSVQRDAATWAQPEEFRPERFLDGDGQRGWIPFGGGKRHCLGSHLALLEMRVVIAEVLRRLDLETVDPADERAALHHVTLVPAQRTRVVVRPRVRELSGV
jgi:cytochrome P450